MYSAQHSTAHHQTMRRFPRGEVAAAARRGGRTPGVESWVDGETSFTACLLY